MDIRLRGFGVVQELVEDLGELRLVAGSRRSHGVLDDLIVSVRSNATIGSPKYMYSMILFMVERSDQLFFGAVLTATDGAKASSSDTTPVKVKRWSTCWSCAYRFTSSQADPATDYDGVEVVPLLAQPSHHPDETIDPSWAEMSPR